MKTKVLIVSVLLMLCIGTRITPQNTFAQGGPVASGFL